MQYWEKMWDERFVQPGYFYGSEPNDFLKENVKIFKPGGRILCLAEGEGRNAVFLAQQGFLVTAVDGSQAGMEKMYALAKERGVNVHGIVSDLADFDFGQSVWDGIVSIWCHLPKPLLSRVMASCVDALTPGGSILIEAYSPQQLKYTTGGPRTVELLNTLIEFQSGFQSLEEVYGVEVEREIFEGRGHTGLSAVVQFIGKRTQQEI